MLISCRVGVIFPYCCLARYDGEVDSKRSGVNPCKRSSEEVAKLAHQLYENKIRREVETELNIGKMVIIDIETGEYEVDEAGIKAAHNLYAKNPYTRLFGICISYNVAASFSGVIERVSSDFRYEMGKGQLI
jgi:hypothetical protein